MTKTPEQMAEEFAVQCPPRFNSHYKAFLAGYQAAKDEMNYPEKPDGWINVKERLPEIADGRFISDDVLWISRHGEMHVSCLEQLRHEIRVDWGEAGLLKLDQVTHWMPLPEPPKEEK